MIVLDVAEEMLMRTKERCKSEGINNIEYILGNGENFSPVKDESVDFFFSYDVFVHIAMEDTWAYSQEMARILVPGGIGICHHASNSVPEAWNRIEQNNKYYRLSRNTLGQFYYYSPESLRRMYERTGLLVFEQHQEAWHCTCIFEKPVSNIVHRMELILRRLISEEANDKHFRAKLLDELGSLQDQLHKVLKPIASDVLREDDFYKRTVYAEKIRRIWRGI